MFGIGSHMPIRQTYWYSTDCSGHECRYQLNGVMRQLSDVAVEAAEDYHGNHDGWEATWPINFLIYESEEGPAVGRFEVERETVPQFHAWERPLEPQAIGVDGGHVELPETDKPAMTRERHRGNTVTVEIVRATAPEPAESS